MFQYPCRQILRLVHNQQYTLTVARAEIRELLTRPGLYLFVPLIMLQATANIVTTVVAFDAPALQTPGTMAVGMVNTLNLLVVLLPIYLLQGLAVLDCIFRRKAWPPFLRGLCYLLAVVVNPLPMILTGIGVFDLWIDFRKPRVKTT